MQKNAKKDRQPQDVAQSSRFSAEVVGIFCMCMAILLLMSLISHDARDPSLNHAVHGRGPVHNWTGMFGAYLSAFLVDFFGFASYTPCLFTGVLAMKYLRKLPAWPWWRWASFLPLGLCIAAGGAAWQIGLGAVRGGGLVGQGIYDLFVRSFSHIGSAVIWASLFLLAVQGIGGFSWRQIGAGLLRRLKDSFDEAAERSRLDKEAAQGSTGTSGAADGKSKCGKNGRPPLISISASDEPSGKMISISAENAGGKEAADNDTPPWLEDLGQDRLRPADPPPPARAEPPPASAQSDAAGAGGIHNAIQNVIIDEQYKAPASVESRPRRAPARLPGLDLLRPADGSARGISRQELEAKGRTLMTVLHDFSIQADLVRITPGPVVTSFEIRPAPGVKSSRISALSDDIALGLKAIAVRIQAPIPGTDTVGIEIPNSARELVSLRELLAAREFQSAEALLTIALGKDTSGVPTTADLVRMPHMLVAGATGTGKSVFLNAVLMSIFYKARPEEVKLLLVDPKRIELAVYADVPHLVHPIVTDMSLAKNALDWAVAEMERRYGDIARLGVRNILSYNEKLKELGAARPPALADLEPMPYLVLIIDELADLMLTAGKDVETSIVRLAQLARAAGIHLIIATQRPSVDVVTGLIKANFPCRISFQVTSKHDSRTILDTVGAEHLLGRGDMLFKPAGGRFQRLHGAYVSDEEVAAVADYWRAQQAPDYRVDFAEAGGSGSGDAPGGEGSGEEDQKYAEAVEFVRQQGKASISLIQRRFRIGFNGAARIIERMEKDGIIGPADGSKPRIVR